MEKVTISLYENQIYELKARQYLDDLGSRSAAVRYIVDEYADIKAEYDDLNTRCESREERIEELESQLRKRSNIEEKIEDLPAKIQSDLSWSEKRTRAYNNASVSERLLWRITGVPEERIEGVDDEG